jgi:uncharacterized LabA/DUF88 family protein
MLRTAILVDGAFYQKRANILFGNKDPESRATELISYCCRHLQIQNHKEKDKELDPVNKEYNYLYRIFYYDCPPSDKVVFHPMLKKNVWLKKTALYEWSNSFHAALISKRKVALRMGELLESSAGYMLRQDALRKLCRGDIKVEDLTEADFYLDIQQKGVDMKIGLDISSLAYKKQVDQIILIAGDSDFVPAAKHARREGIDFILDPMWHTIKPSLNEHIDGLTTKVAKEPDNLRDPLCIINKTKT